MVEDKDKVTIVVNAREKVVASEELNPPMANSPSTKWWA